MKTKLHYILIIFSVIGCSSSKKVTQKSNEAKTATTSEIIVVKEFPDNILNQQLTNKVNGIIENYLGVPISSIARSDIEETTEGYQWKFMNVKTGENFIANSDFNFISIKIIKNKRS